MDIKSFYPLYVSKLSVADLYSLSKGTIDYSLPVKETMSDLMKAALTKLETSNGIMGTALSKQMKSGLTPVLQSMNVKRKDSFAEVKRNITTDCKSSNERTKAAASTLKLFMEPYWYISRKAMNTVSAVLTEMFVKYHAEENLQTHATTIGIADIMNTLETTNSEFIQMYHARDNEVASNDGPTASGMKTEVIRDYENFCTIIEKGLSYLPNRSIDDLFFLMDELRKRYVRIASGIKDEGTPTEPATV